MLKDHMERRLMTMNAYNLRKVLMMLKLVPQEHKRRYLFMISQNVIEVLRDQTTPMYKVFNYSDVLVLLQESKF
jgi:hypothetical protein